MKTIYDDESDSIAFEVGDTTMQIRKVCDFPETPDALAANPHLGKNWELRLVIRDVTLSVRMERAALSHLFHAAGCFVDERRDVEIWRKKP